MLTDSLTGEGMASMTIAVKPKDTYMWGIYICIRVTLLNGLIPV